MSQLVNACQAGFWRLRRRDLIPEMFGLYSFGWNRTNDSATALLPFFQISKQLIQVVIETGGQGFSILSCFFDNWIIPHPISRITLLAAKGYGIRI